MNDETIAGIQLGPFIPGLLGAALSMRAIADAKPVTKVLATVLGAGASGYVAPAFGEAFHLTTNMQNAVGFVVGLLILNVSAGMLKLSTRFAVDPIGATKELLMLVTAFRYGRGKPEAEKVEEGTQ